MYLAASPHILAFRLHESEVELRVPKYSDCVTAERRTCVFFHFKYINCEQLYQDFCSCFLFASGANIGTHRSMFSLTRFRRTPVTVRCLTFSQHTLETQIAHQYC